MWLKRIGLFFLLYYAVSMGFLAISFVYEPTYTWRFMSYPFRKPITTLGWYQPLERVDGTPTSALPLHPALVRGASFTTEDPLSPRVRDLLTQHALRTRTSALLVMHNDQILYERYFGSHHAKALSNSMSMAKTILAMLIGIALHEKRIDSVDDFASRYLPEWGRDRRSGIRIRHLLQMRSGLRSDGVIRNPFNDVVRLYHTPNLLSFLWQIPVVAPPGEIYDYKDVDSQVLGVLLERATQTRYARYLSEKLWRPMGASDAFVWLDHPEGTAKTTCCIFATARDWARVGQLILHNGQRNGQEIIPAAWLDEMTQPSRFDPDYGYLIWRGSPQGSRRNDRSEAFLADDLLYLDGLFQQRVYIVPSRRLVIVRIGEDPHHWDDAFLPNTLLRALTPLMR